MSLWNSFQHFWKWRNCSLNGTYTALWVWVWNESLKRIPRHRAQSYKQMGTAKAPFIVVQWKGELNTTKPAEFTAIHMLCLWLCHCIWTVSLTSFMLFLCLCKANQALTTTTVLSDGAAEINSPQKTVSHYQDCSAFIWSHPGKNTTTNNHKLFFLKSILTFVHYLEPKIAKV